MTRRGTTLALLLILALAAFLTKERWLAVEAPVKPVEPQAYLRSEWGMTPDEVTQANGTALSAVAPGRRFYETEPGAETRTRTLEATGQKFLGREAAIRYTFKDDRLTSYHVFVSDRDCAALDEDMRRYLYRRFGAGAGETDDGTGLKLVWQSKDRVVNYWFFEEEMALSKPCRAVLGERGIATWSD